MHGVQKSLHVWKEKAYSATKDKLELAPHVLAWLVFVVSDLEFPERDAMPHPERTSVG